MPSQDSLPLSVLLPLEEGHIERGFMANESFGVPCLDYTYGESQLHVLN